jgi:ribonucleotide monophosphatase NagD (HAD superfamily)
MLSNILSGIPSWQVVGKPEASFFQQALAELGCRPQEAAMIGGRLPLCRHNCAQPPRPA